MKSHNEQKSCIIMSEWIYLKMLHLKQPWKILVHVLPNCLSKNYLVFHFCIPDEII